MPVLSCAVVVADALLSVAWAAGIVLKPECVPGGLLWVPWCLACALLFLLCSKSEGGGRTQFLGLIFGVAWGWTFLFDALVLALKQDLEGCQKSYFELDLKICLGVLAVNSVALRCHRRSGNEAGSGSEPLLEGA
mmetsp:Transcript_126555/g.405105  ORF Transcript_126555/g.405105 Transcript_126555/m.405105 type:complete len:135 (+) Transcript_126555:80-484(+)|eukprot:CAMPEP_0203919074 /NCGR_PEP_ID=MMETSP0359-20131031/59552_1 /ASSEMBLY_ACC=CAM_ASM_000338 /TAXON_ID=268821 /ORGANISM="Scrippsiella Hangoei, Strain SHTV-5" /LENGTH=134 /DNA_ID=CAMNT_0050846287 /DNA_START=60 /DNA_END=464 /DNA_ORIENTATION=-